MRTIAMFAVLLLVVSCATQPPAPPPQETAPIARVENVVETIHGTPVSDPYRWMESGGDEFNSWAEAQRMRARSALDALAMHQSLLEAIDTADRGVARVSIAGVTGDAPRVFLFKRQPDDDVSSLWVREGWNGTDRLLVDPRTRNSGDVHHSIDYVTPSWDGRYIAYGVSASGSEDSVIEILEVDSGKVLPERIDRAQYAAISWRPDNRSFFYWRRAKPAPGAKREDWFRNSATYLHTLGDDPEKAAPLFGPMVKNVSICEECFSWIQTSPTSRWILAGSTPGTSADLEYFVAPADSVRAGAEIPWRRISGSKDRLWGLAAHGDRLYALSYDAAPRFKVLELDAASGTLATAREFVPQRSGVIEDYDVAKDAMYVRTLEGGLSRVYRYSWSGGAPEEVALPFAGTVYGVDARPDHDGAWFTMASWTRPQNIYMSVPGAPVRDLGLIERWPVDYSHIRSEEVEVRSADGTMVPMSIVIRNDAKKDGSLPALLGGYAAYGTSQSPYFWPIGLVWVDRGGVYAECHSRGGGARGKQWHEAGTKHNKERGIEDSIACAEYLVANGYTKPSRLSITGTSAGGILAGGVITRRPDLFTAALLRVPVVNLLRIEKSEGGPANVPEYGTVADAEDFRHLLASDPYHRLKANTRYPAMVVTGGMHDVRVPVWQPAKFVARAQALSTGGPILFRVETGAGHGLGSRRSQIREEWADLFAFALAQSR